MLLTKRRICWSLLALLLVAGLSLAAFWKKSPTSNDPAFYIIPPKDYGDTPVLIDSAAAQRIFEQLPTDPNIQTGGLGFTLVSHGWKENETWYQDLALALREKTPEPWLFAWYDWQKQSQRINPTEVARLAKFKFGPAVGQQISELECPITHIHLIAHSAGSWLINEAAKLIAQKRDSSLHLTFLDAYVPAGWNEDELGDVSPDPNAVQQTLWSDHYLTHDHTLAFTHQTLKHAHNVDLTAIAHGMNRHRFAFYWYHATITGRYPRKKYAQRPVYSQFGNTHYGFPLTREADKINWQEVLSLVPGNRPISLKKTKNKESVK